MIKSTLLYILFSAIMWWGVFVVHFSDDKVNRELILTEEGLVINAVCVDSRNIGGIKFKIESYTDRSVTDRYISMPIDVECNEILLNRIINNDIRIVSYENHYLEVVAGGELLIEMEEAIRNIENNKGVLYFLIANAVMATLISVLKIRGIAKITN